MRRRLVLLTVLVLVLVTLAGCSSPRTVAMDPVPNDSELAERATDEVEELQGESKRLAIGAINGSNPTASGVMPPFEPKQPYAYDGEYYNITWTVEDNEDNLQYRLKIDSSPNNTTGDRIAYEDLPIVDQRALSVLAGDSLPDELNDEGGNLGVISIYNATERQQSMLVPQAEYDLVTVDGRIFQVTNDGSESVTGNTYRYNATRIASSASGMAEVLESKYMFTLSDLSSDEQEIVEDAIDNRHEESGSASDAFNSLVERFRSQDSIDPQTGDEYLVSYEGKRYWVYLDTTTSW